MSEQLLSDSRRSHECFLNISEIQLRLLQAVLLDGHVLVYRVDKQKLHLVRRIFLGGPVPSALAADSLPETG